MIHCYHSNIFAFWAMCRTCRALCAIGTDICCADGICRAELYWVVWGLFTEPRYLRSARNITSAGPPRSNALVPRFIYWHLPGSCIDLSAIPLVFCATITHANTYGISVGNSSVNLNEFSRSIEQRSELLAVEYVPMYHSRFILSYRNSTFAIGDNVQIVARLYVKGMLPTYIVLVWHICDVVVIC